MSAIKKLHDYLAKSPSVIYPDDVLAYLPAIEDENERIKDEKARLLNDNNRLQDIVTDDELHMQQMQDEIIRLRKLVQDALRPSYDKSMRMTLAQWREYDADVLRRARELKVEI